MTSAATLPSCVALWASIGSPRDVADRVDVADVRAHLAVDGDEAALVDRRRPPPRRRSRAPFGRRPTATRMRSKVWPRYVLAELDRQPVVARLDRVDPVAEVDRLVARRDALLAARG